MPQFPAILAQFPVIVTKFTPIISQLAAVTRSSIAVTGATFPSQFAAIMAQVGLVATQFSAIPAELTTFVPDPGLMTPQFAVTTFGKPAGIGRFNCGRVARGCGDLGFGGGQCEAAKPAGYRDYQGVFQEFHTTLILCSSRPAGISAVGRGVRIPMRSPPVMPEL